MFKIKTPEGKLKDFYSSDFLHCEHSVNHFGNPSLPKYEYFIEYNYGGKILEAQYRIWSSYIYYLIEEFVEQLIIDHAWNDSTLLNEFDDAT